MGADLAGLDALLSRVRNMRGVISRALPGAADAMRSAIQATASAGTSPEGEAWAPRKKDGGRALANAASKIRVLVAGSSLVAIINGPEAIHNEGKKNTPARPILPQSMTPRIAEAIKGAIVAAWEAR